MSEGRLHPPVPVPAGPSALPSSSGLLSFSCVIRGGSARRPSVRDAPPCQRAQTGVARKQCAGRQGGAGRVFAARLSGPLLWVSVFVNSFAHLGPRCRRCEGEGPASHFKSIKTLRPICGREEQEVMREPADSFHPAGAVRGGPSSWRPASCWRSTLGKFPGFLSNLTVCGAADPPSASANLGDLCTVSAYPSSNICSRLA